MKSPLLLVSVLAATLFSVQIPSAEARHFSGQSYLYGRVTLTTGNCMPSPQPDPSCITRPVSRTIFIRKLTASTQQPSRLVAVTRSNRNGFYSVRLPRGTYSVFVRDRDTQYCKLTDQGNLCPVTVKRGATRYDISIDHSAR